MLRFRFLGGAEAVPGVLVLTGFLGGFSSTSWKGSLLLKRPRKNTSHGSRLKTVHHVAAVLVSFKTVGQERFCAHKSGDTSIQRELATASCS